MTRSIGGIILIGLLAIGAGLADAEDARTLELQVGGLSQTKLLEFAEAAR